jgi:Zn ribbon nucleic-acid-binding protein
MGAPKRSLSSLEVLSTVWGEFRAGKRATCPACSDALALAVDAAGGGYRFVCAACGHASVWFDSTHEGVRVRDFAQQTFDAQTMSDGEEFDDER